MRALASLHRPRRPPYDRYTKRFACGEFWHRFEVGHADLASLSRCRYDFIPAEGVPQDELRSDGVMTLDRVVPGSRAPFRVIMRPIANVVNSMENIISALVGALIGALLTRYFARRDTAEQRASNKTADYVSRIAPVFGALLSAELPEIIKDQSIPARFKSEWASLAREGSILGLFQDSRAVGITALIQKYTAALVDYSNGRLVRADLEVLRKATIADIERVLEQFNPART